MNSKPTALCSDTRFLGQGDRFFALGNFPIQKCIQELREANLHSFVSQVPVADDLNCEKEIVDDSRLSFLLECASFYRELFEGFTYAGITGTKGKTSIAWMLNQAWEKLGIRSAYIGTLGIQWGSHFVSGVNTTPGLQNYLEILSGFKADGVKNIAMEMSSQGMMQHRFPVDFIQHRLFTDLSEEHLDCHISMENYFREKQRLFLGYLIDTKVIPTAHILDRSIYGNRMVNQDFGGRVLRFGLQKVAHNLQIIEIIESIEKTVVRLKRGSKVIEISLSGFGLFQVENLMGVLSVLAAQELDLFKLDKWHIPSVPGRVELVGRFAGASIFVDYAHSSQSLEFVLQAARRQVKGKLHLVFGCGGDRDPGKRPKMGYSASQYCDSIIITNDNPRSEDAQSIAKQVLAGVDKTRLDRVQVLLDRKSAIEEAIRNLKANDCLLVCGKGHEDYQIIGDQTFEFCDRKVIREITERN